MAICEQARRMGIEIEIIGSVYFLGTNEYCNLTATVIHLMPTGHKDPHPKLPNLDLSKWEIRWLGFYGCGIQIGCIECIERHGF